MPVKYPASLSASAPVSAIRRSRPISAITVLRSTDRPSASAFAKTLRIGSSRNSQVEGTIRHPSITLDRDRAAVSGRRGSECASRAGVISAAMSAVGRRVAPTRYSAVSRGGAELMQITPVSPRGITAERHGPETGVEGRRSPTGASQASQVGWWPPLPSLLSCSRWSRRS